ncbi:helix-turn-helix domain-containing protein [Phytoactinopolyspora mesophila]|uniref:Helix-turn-helix domain-containing protein n=1 Tax=Phytoactinopolyspora mesophila TaxID=2650750 RepID=A0A7K3MAI0_9ACTN|nr:hypothetical protein [Phytoactinopolyspora mesophila]NDL60190.1 hypothetical protein [Phytoactinopolyspora mesophila]
MDTVHSWTGIQTAALRRAMRMSVRDFAAHLGVAIRTVSKWETRRDSITLQPASQAMLDVVLNRASDHERARFAQLVETDRETSSSEEPPAALKKSDIFLPLVVDGQTVLTPLFVNPADGQAIFNIPAGVTGVPANPTAVAAESGCVRQEGTGRDDMEIARGHALGVLAYGLAATAWGDSRQPRPDRRHRQYLRAEIVDRIRLAALGYNHMAAEPVAVPLAEREAAVREAELDYQAANYEAVAWKLPGLIKAASVAGDASRSMQESCSSTYAVAAKLLTKVGEAELAWVCADRAATAAMVADSTSAKSAAAYQLVGAMLAAGEKEPAECLAVRTAERLTASRRTLDEPELLSRTGALWLISAVIAARRGDLVETDQRLAQAESLGERLGRNANHGWTAFGPTNVVIHRLSAAMEVGDPRKVLRLADSLDPETLPVGLRGRRAQVHLNLAWAHAQLRNDDAAVVQLQALDRTAPELLRFNGVSTNVIRELLRRERHGRIAALRPIARRAGVS